MYSVSTALILYTHWFSPCRSNPDLCSRTVLVSKIPTQFITPRILLEANKTPETGNKETPKTENSETPKMENSKTPKMENSKTPKMENSETPKMENLKTSKMENSKTPKMENLETPKMENSVPDECLSWCKRGNGQKPPFFLSAVLSVRIYTYDKAGLTSRVPQIRGNRTCVRLRFLSLRQRIPGKCSAKLYQSEFKHRLFD